MSVSTAKKAKAGGNWKKLQRTLTNEEGSSSNGSNKRLRTNRSSSSTIHTERPKPRTIANLESRDSSSPAPTTLPWFAEDLSPEDLALVHQAGGRTSTSSSRGMEQTILEEVGADITEERKKQVILGGEDLSKEKQEPGTYIAIDCEMVGVGPEGSESILARVSIVNWHGAILMDTFVKPKEKVTDYRTWVSGVRPSDLYGAPSFEQVQADVAKLIKGRVLVGHAIHNDLKALLLSHPKPLLRDTAQNKHCRELAKTKHPSLKKLVLLKLGLEIQKQGSAHSPVEDARATMALYRTLHADWQKTMSTSASIIGRGWKKVDKKKDNIGKSGGGISKTKSSTQDPDWWKHV